MENIPFGYRFSTTDKEIIEHYLYKKVKGETLPHDYVKDCDVYGDKEPWKLFDKTAKQNFYVFVRLSKRSSNGSAVKRTAGCGTWKGQKTKRIKDDQGRVIGLEKLLIFEVPEAFESQAKDNGHWVMHEFSIIGSTDPHVMCRIRNKDLDKVEPSLEWNTRKCSQLEEEEESHPRKRIRSSVCVVDNDTEPIMVCNQKQETRKTTNCLDAKALDEIITNLSWNGVFEQFSSPADDQSQATEDSCCDWEDCIDWSLDFKS